MKLIATAVGLCVTAHEDLTKRGIKARVVSMPCWELFERQPQAYRYEVLPPSITARVASRCRCARTDSRARRPKARGSRA